MGEEAGYEIKPFGDFPEEYQHQSDVLAVDDRRMIIALLGGTFSPMILLYDYASKTSQPLRNLEDEYREFNGTALNVYPPSVGRNLTYWRYLLLSHARSAGKVGVLLRNVVTKESHVRIMDLDDYSFEDAGIYSAWLRVVSGEVTLKDIWIRE